MHNRLGGPCKLAPDAIWRGESAAMLRTIETFRSTSRAICCENLGANRYGGREKGLARGDCYSEA